MESDKKLVRSRRDRVFGGVLGGIAEHFNFDSTLLRLIFIFIAFVSVKGALLLYIILYLIIPDEKNANTTNKSREDRTTLGIVLIVVGLILFLNELYSFLTFKLIWPILLIIAGFYVLIKGIEEGRNEN